MDNLSEVESNRTEVKDNPGNGLNNVAFRSIKQLQSQGGGDW